jgi:hypothetical protein
MTRKKIRVTKHAKERAGERLGISYQSQVRKNFNKAIQYGKSPDCFRGPFADYLQSKKAKQRGNVGIKVYDGSIVIYRNHTVITTFKVPAQYRPTSQYLPANWNNNTFPNDGELVYLNKLCTLCGGENVDYEVFPPSGDEGSYITGLYINDMFEGFGRGTTEAKSINAVARAYLKRINKEVDDEEV